MALCACGRTTLLNPEQDRRDTSNQDVSAHWDFESITDDAREDVARDTIIPPVSDMGLPDGAQDVPPVREDVPSMDDAPVMEDVPQTEDADAGSSTCDDRSLPAFCPDEDGRVGSWLVLGPYDYAGCGMELTQVIDAGRSSPVAGQRQGERTWTEVTADVLDRRFVTPCSREDACLGGPVSVDLNCHFSGGRRTNGEPEHAMAYAFTFVLMESDREVRLSVGGDDGFRVWLDSELIIDAEDNCACYSDDQVTREVFLRAGTHRIMAQVGDNTGHWGFVLRLLDMDGRPIRDGVRTGVRP
jgi:hypothetical protein